MKNVENIMATAVMAIGLTDIESVLGITLVLIQLGLILLRCGLSIYDSIKKKELHEVAEILEETSKQTEELVNKITNKGGAKDENK